MQRHDAHQTRKKRRRLLLLLPVAMVAIAAATVLASGAVFTATSANPANTFTAGNLTHSNSKDGSAILQVEKMKPGDTVTGTVVITNDGDLDGEFSLSASDYSSPAGAKGGKLGDVLTLAIEEDGDEIYAGGLDLGGDSIDLGTFEAGEDRTYEFVVSFPKGSTPAGPEQGDNQYKGATVSVDYDWLEVQTDDAEYEIVTTP